MQNRFKTRIMVLAVVCASVFAARANAECGDLSKFKFGASIHQQSWGGSQFSPASLLLVTDSGEPIVGFWKVTFTSEGTTGIPDGAVIDQAYAQWHSDGTEIMNSSRSPVRKAFAWEYGRRWVACDTSSIISRSVLDPNSNLVGPANIREKVV